MKGITFSGMPQYGGWLEGFNWFKNPAVCMEYIQVDPNVTDSQHVSITPC